MAENEAPIAGVGAQFMRWNAGTGTWVPIAKVRSITGPSMTRNTIDTTALDTTGGYRTFITGFRDPGTVALGMCFNRDGYEAMKTDFEDDDAQDYQIILPDFDETSLTFSGLVTELPLTIPTDDLVTADVTIKISGTVSLESGSAPSPV